MLRNNADARRCSYFELGLPVIKRTVVINSTTQHARHRKCEKLPPTIFSIFILKKRDLTNLFDQFQGTTLVSISFCLYRACLTHLISSNLSCNLCPGIYVYGTGAPNGNFRENICSEDDLRSRIFGAFVVKFLTCLPLLGFSNIYKMV